MVLKQIPVHWIDLQNSFGICELGCSWRKLNKRLHSGFAPRLLEALMGTLQTVPLTGPFCKTTCGRCFISGPDQI